MATQNWSDRRSLEDDNVQQGLYLSLWLLRTQTRPSLRNLDLHSSVSTNCFQQSTPNCLISFLTAARPMRLFRVRRRRIVQCQTVLSGLKLLNPVRSFWMLSFGTFLSRNLSSRFDSCLGRPDLGFFKVGPFATKVFHMVRYVELSFPN